MKACECEFEAEVLAAVIQSRWPERTDERLRAHVNNCAICGDVAAVAAAIEESRQEIRGAAVLPDSGRVWWLAQMRLRREAVKTAGRPIAAAQVLAAAGAVLLMGASFGAAAAWFQGHVYLVAVMAALILLVPVSVYLVVGRD